MFILLTCVPRATICKMGVTAVQLMASQLGLRMKSSTWGVRFRVKRRVEYTITTYYDVITVIVTWKVEMCFFIVNIRKMIPVTRHPNYFIFMAISTSQRYVYMFRVDQYLAEMPRVTRYSLLRYDQLTLPGSTESNIKTIFSLRNSYSWCKFVGR